MYKPRPYRIPASKLSRIHAAVDAHELRHFGSVVGGRGHNSLALTEMRSSPQRWDDTIKALRKVLSERHQNRLLIAAILEHERSDA